MTSASSLHFGPEWMRKPSRGSLSSHSPNAAGNSPSATSNMLPTPPTQAAPALPNVSSYSSLLTSTSPPPEIKSEDESYPFRYSKDQMIRVWKDGGGRGGLGLEVERWPGIVREVGGEPVGVRDMTQEERKLFSMPVNSDPPVRRNNSSLSLAPDRQSTKFGQGIGIGLGPVSPRGMGVPRRRGTGNADDPTSAPFLPRKLSVTSTLLPGGVGNGTPGLSGGPLPSPTTRTRVSTLDGSDVSDPWSRGSAAGGATDPGWSAMGARRRANDAQGARAWGGTAGTPTGGGLGIGRGMTFGSLSNGTPSRNGSEHDKISPSVSPGPDPTSDPDAIAPAQEGDPEPGIELDVTNIVNGGEPPQNPPAAANTIYATNGPGAPPPEPTEDFANIQWSYKDPTGQVQGPFIGATMQQWFESGYFNDGLLIKRTTIDSDFEPLRDFRRRAPPARPSESHPQMFLSPLAPRAPPNLPPPQPHLLNNNPPLNPSPRLAHLMTGVGDPSNHGPMSAGVTASPLAASPALSATARSATLDSYLNTSPHSNEGLVAGSIGSAALTNAAFERKKREDFIQSLREQELAMGVNVPPQQPMGMPGPFGGGFIPNPTVQHPQYSAFGSGNQVVSPTYNSRLVLPPAPLNGPVSNVGLSVVSPFPHNGPVLWSSSGGEQLNTPTSFNSASPGGFDHSTIYQSIPVPVQQQQQGSGVWLDNFAPQPPSWESEPLPPAVEAAAHIADEPLQTPITDSGVHDSPVSAQPALPAETESTAIEGITSALEQTSIQEEPAEIQEIIPEPIIEPEPTPVPAPAPAPVEVPAPSNKRKGANKGKTASTGAATTPVTIPPKESVAPGTPSPVSPPPPAKAWATPDEDKAGSLSLREIQEAEARKAEARKAAERVTKAVPPPLTSTNSDESVQAVTGSWGLPQVGSRSTAPAPAPATNGAPAWTKPVTVPTGKKSMKEIQEEEEKRKKAIAAKEAQAIAQAQQASKRAYAESAKNITTTTTSGGTSAGGGGAWTTVGAKPSNAGATAAVRQQPSSSVGQPASSAARVVSGGSGAVPGPRPSSSASSTTQASAKPAKPAASSSAVVAEDAPVPPSLDFLKWLKEALKGLNGVNVEEFMQMLLSFPLDPSPTVIEIISDSVYANSSTLDGRRFAAEFCQKRKLDAAAARTKASSGSKAPARASLADVVKTQPKPVQSEWGFKTVQKKAKGGRK